ncbi:MAG: glycosyl transferase, partial [Bifidobacterium sp.]
LVGVFISRGGVEKLGFPDPRFFIYWDDTLYGYLASKVTTPIVIPDMVMRRTREISNWDIAGVRQLNSTSDMNRHYIMRNRAFMARYFMQHGDYRPLMFSLGTLATFAKEMIRLIAVDRSHLMTGIRALVGGWWESRALLHDPSWKPMPPLK